MFENLLGEIEKSRFESSYTFIIKSKEGIVFDCWADQLVADDTYEYVIAYNSENSDYAQDGIVFKNIEDLRKRLSSEDLFDSYTGEPLVSTEEKRIVMIVGKYMINEVDNPETENPV